MTTKLWARLPENEAATQVVLELVSLDAELVPGKDIFHPSWRFEDVTAVSGIAVGWVKTGSTWAAPPVVPPTVFVPQAIERRQFFQQLAIENVITNAEALAALQTGTIPPEMQSLVAGLPTADQFNAQMLIVGAPTFNRNAPLTLALGAAKGWTSDQIDALWIAAAAL